MIELLVVIGIIALLAAMLVPTINSAMRSGKRAACLSNVHQIAVGGQLLLEELEDDLPPDEDCAGYDSFAGAAIEHLPYLKCGFDVFDCPENKGIDSSGRTRFSASTRTLPSECIAPETDAATDYEFNSYINSCENPGARQNGVENPNVVAYVWDNPWKKSGDRAHTGGSSCGFLDGHGEFLLDTETWTDMAGNVYEMWDDVDTWWQERGHIWGRTF